MSPSRSKSKEKMTVGKESVKPSTKPTTSASTGGGVPASGYNPLLGTFHTLETSPVSSVPPVHVNGRFRDIDDVDDPSGNSVGIVVEYDCVSNNGSCSGESEDPKDKPSQGPTRQEANSGVDIDKREKIRQKNEKKHQRQKERRAQELHERCCGYLMSRKLEALAQQLVAMGFPSERATMALILNEGKLEESVAWLFEGGKDSVNQKEPKFDNGGGGNLKVDISQELAQIADMEVKFKCSKQEVERVAVACEGDLEKAADNLFKLQKPDPPKPEETGDPVKPSVSITQTSKVRSKQNPSSGAMSIQQKADHRDISYPTMAVTTTGRSLAESPGVKNIQMLKKVLPAPIVEKMWAVGGMQAAPPPLKTETQCTNGENALKNLQIGSVREPVTMMQRLQARHSQTTNMSSSPSSSSGFYVSDWKFNGMVEPVHPNGVHSTQSFNTPTYGGNHQFHYQPHHVPTSGLIDHHGGQPPVATNHLNNSGMLNSRMVSSTLLSAATSLGLFSGFGSNGASGPSHVDWNGDWSSQSDYTNIDWSLNRLPSPASSALRPNGLWMGAGSSPGKSVVRPGIIANGNSSMSIGGVGVGGSEASGGGSREWASPFEEKDLFSLPRRFVSSPSL